MTFIKNIKAAFDAPVDEKDRALVEWILITAGMALVAIAAVAWIGNAAAGKAADTSNCIAGSSTYSQSDSSDACKSTVNADKAKQDNQASDGWKSRFGSN